MEAESDFVYVCVCEGIREGLPFLATEENTNRGLTDAWLSQDGKFTATGPGVIMSAVRSCNNVDIDCVGRNLRCIEDYTRNNCFSLRPADTSLVSPSLRYFYHIPFGALLRRFESNRRPFSLSLSLSIAILNPFSSPEDEDWIGRVSSGWNCRERKRGNERMYVKEI